MALARAVPSVRRSEQLVEREDALAVLRRYLDEEATAVGRIVLIRGEASIGKTALLKAFVQDCSTEMPRFGAPSSRRRFGSSSSCASTSRRTI